MSLRYILRLIEAFFKRFKAIIIISIIIGMVVFLLISYILPSITSTNKRIGVLGRYTTDMLPDEISKLISLGLTDVDMSGNPVPAIAKSWDSTDGGKTWTFILNDNVKWQDGKMFTTSDVDYKFNDASIEIIDSKTIKFKLDSAFSAFPVILNKPIFKKGLLGTGEWKVKNISMIGGYVQKITIADKKGDKRTYKFYPTDERLKLAFKLGEIDILQDIQDPTPFDKWKTVNVDEQVGYNHVVVLFINTQNEKLADKSARQGLSYAINKDNFSNTKVLDVERALGPISPYSWAYNPQVKPYIRDLSKAKDLKDLKITISTLPNLLKTAEVIKKDWQEAGIVSEIEVVTSVPESFQTFLATVDIPKDPDQYSLWHSTQVSTNISNLKNDRIDKLLEDGRTKLDQETRKKIYLDFQRFLVEEVPAIFLYHPTFYTITRK